MAYYTNIYDEKLHKITYYYCNIFQKLFDIYAKIVYIHLSEDIIGLGVYTIYRVYIRIYKALGGIFVGIDLQHLQHIININM